MDDHSEEKKYIRVHKTVIIVIALILAAGIFGWWMGRSGTSEKTENNSNTQPTETDATVNTPSDVTSIATFTLPDGWKQERCEGSGAIFVVPSGSPSANCDSNPVSPVKVSVDPNSTNDCNQLQDVTEVKKHICKSLFINDMKSLEASTEYLASSSYGKETTLNAYYINTGEGVIKVEYIFSGNNQYQAGFEQLAKSVNKK